MNLFVYGTWLQVAGTVKDFRAQYPALREYIRDATHTLLELKTLDGRTLTVRAGAIDAFVDDEAAQHPVT